MLDDPDLLRFTRIPEPVPPGFARAWLERYEEGRHAGNREAFAVVDEAGEFLGIAMAPGIDHETATAELGYVVGPAARGRGVASEALRQLNRVGVRAARDSPARATDQRRQPGVEKSGRALRLHPRRRPPVVLRQAGPARGHRDLVAPRDRSI